MGRTPVGRRFTVLDAMILLAATAVALAVVRVAWLDRPPRLPPWDAAAIWAEATQWAGALAPFGYAWTPTLLALSLRGPRPARRRLMRLPGAVACVAAVAVMAAGLLGCGVLAGAGEPLHVADSWAVARPESEVLVWIVPAKYDGATLARVLAGLAPAVGLGVLGGWVALAASGRWRADPGWIDRVGRVVGVGWLLTLPTLGLAQLMWIWFNFP